MTSSAKLALPDAPRLLIARPDRVGDVIISTSCITPIRQSFPRVHFTSTRRNECARCSMIIRTLTALFPIRRRSDRSTLDAVVHLHPDKACYRAARRANVPVRIGYQQRFLGRYLTHSLPDRRSDGAETRSGL